MLLHMDDQLVDMFKISLCIVYVHKYAHCKDGRCRFYNLNNIYIYRNLMEHQGLCMFPDGISHFLSCGFLSPAHLICCKCVDIKKNSISHQPLLHHVTNGDVSRKSRKRKYDRDDRNLELPIL